MSEFDQSTPPEQAQTRRKPPLSQLRLKNWRSLKDVTIDFDTPITVFIGANSSGKSNILDALKFRLDMAVGSGITGAVFKRGDPSKLLTHGDLTSELVISFSYVGSREDNLLTNELTLKFDETGDFRYSYKIRLLENEQPIFEEAGKGPSYEPPKAKMFYPLHIVDGLRDYQQAIFAERLQILTEGFSPPMELDSNYHGLVFPNNNQTSIEPDARNLPRLLDFMRQVHPEEFERLAQDASWLLSHISDIKTRRTIEKTQIVLREHAEPHREAPMVSEGTARMLAMITGYYLLDLNTEPPSPEMKEYWHSKQSSLEKLSQLPGVVVIEEPDTALNPGILSRFVNLLRQYTLNENPRQFILTTHNPAFLNYFEPEEVRIVERDDRGYTQVKRVPSHIRDVWLDEYGLGEVWTTNSLGGLGE